VLIYKRYYFNNSIQNGSLNPMILNLL